VKNIYGLTSNIPNDEMFGLISELRRRAISISSNIGEKKKRGSEKDFSKFLRINDGSATELETQLIIIEYRNQIDIKDSLQLLLGFKKILATILKSFPCKL